jgi:calcium-independent phospholipase A2-gamma
VVFTLPFKGVTPEAPEALRTYINANIEPKPKPWTIWEAVRATSAATTFFEPLVHGPPESRSRYIDAGLGFNNPADLVFEEAASFWTDTGYLNTERDIGCFLTLGTGMGDVTRMDNDTIVKAVSAKFRVPKQAVEAMKKIATSTEPTHRNMAQRFDHDTGVYQRFNVDQGLQAVSLFDYEKLEEIGTDARAYLGKHTVRMQLSKAVEVMRALGPQTRELMAEHKEDESEIFSWGDDKNTDDEKLKKRLDALRM